MKSVCKKIKRYIFLIVIGALIIETVIIIIFIVVAFNQINTKIDTNFELNRQSYEYMDKSNKSRFNSIIKRYELKAEAEEELKEDFIANFNNISDILVIGQQQNNESYKTLNEIKKVLFGD